MAQYDGLSLLSSLYLHQTFCWISGMKQCLTIAHPTIHIQKESKRMKRMTHFLCLWVIVSLSFSGWFHCWGYKQHNIFTNSTSHSPVLEECKSSLSWSCPCLIPLLVIQSNLPGMLQVFAHIYLPPWTHMNGTLVSSITNSSHHTHWLLYQWPLEAHGPYVGLASACLYIEHAITRVHDQVSGWPFSKLCRAFEEELLPSLSFIIELHSLLPIDSEDHSSQSTFDMQFCLGSDGLEPVVTCLHSLHHLITAQPPILSQPDQQMAICLINPYAHALQQLMQHLRNTCNHVYYDLCMISDLQALLQDKGHFLAVFIIIQLILKKCASNT